MDGIVVILMHLQHSSGTFRQFELTVQRRTLLEFSNAQARAGAVGVGTDLAVPWEKWGPNKTHILELDSFMGRRGSSVAGERCATVLTTCITIRDYNPYRVACVVGWGWSRGQT
jgi:hypothetical protein